MLYWLIQIEIIDYGLFVILDSSIGRSILFKFTLKPIPCKKKYKPGKYFDTLFLLVTIILRTLEKCLVRTTNDPSSIIIIAQYKRDRRMR